MSACTCGHSSSQAALDAGASTPEANSHDNGELPLSLPFAASRGPGGDVYVAGLVAARNVLGVARYSKKGALMWSADALTDVGWSPDAEVRVLANDVGLAVTWRGLRAKALVREVVVMDENGKKKGDPQSVGVGSCATNEGVVWAQRQENSSSIQRLTFASLEKRELGSITKDLDPELACGTHRVFVVEEGDGDLGLSTFGMDGNAPSVPLLSSDSDNEEQHWEFTVGDSFGVVRANENGKLFVREASPSLHPWRSFGYSPSNDDDVVAVDGDEKYVYVVATRDAERCDGSSAASDIWLFRTRRDAASRDIKDDSALFASEPCGFDVGPVFTGQIGSKFVVVWEELGHGVRGAPPVSGFAYRIVGDPETKRISAAADAMALAGCDETKCYAVMLGRTTVDAMSPGVAKIISFP